jgi:hypothetical protein
MKRQVFEAMQRVVMDEGAHGPVLRDHFTRKTHDTAKLHSAGVGILPACYLFHRRDPISTV